MNTKWTKEHVNSSGNLQSKEVLILVERSREDFTQEAVFELALKRRRW